MNFIQEYYTSPVKLYHILYVSFITKAYHLNYYPLNGNQLK